MKNHVWRNKKGFSRNNKKVVRDETSEVDRQKSMYRSYSYVCNNPAQDECIRLHVILKKSQLMLFDRHPKNRNKQGECHFWSRGYYVSTAGNVNEETT